MLDTPVQFEILKSVISETEAECLRKYIESKLPNEGDPLDDYSQTTTLQYRPDEWDSCGTISKLQDIAKDYLKQKFEIGPELGPKEFVLVRTDNFQQYVQEYGDIDPNEIFYTAIVTPTPSSEYVNGRTLYTHSGEGFWPSSVDMVIHRNEYFNNWEIQDVHSGYRLDLIFVFRQINRRISYAFDMPQTDDDVLEDF